MLRSLALAPRAVVRGIAVSARCSSTESKVPTKREVDELFAERPDQKRRSAFSKNRVEIVGGVAVDPVLRTGRNEKPFTMLNVITNHRVRQPNGEFTEKSERHSISVFGKQAEIIAKTITRGTRVVVEGRLHYSGGELKEDGERTPRQIHIHAVTVQPLAKSSAFRDE